MANLWPCEATNNDPRVGGIVVQFESGARKVVSWNHGAPLSEQDCLTWSKEIASNLVAHLMSHQMEEDIRRTNWASMVAAILKIVRDWNAALRESLHADAARDQSRTVH